MSNFVKLVKLFQDNVIKYHTYTFTKSDKPNMKSDDAILKREYVDLYQKDYKVEIYNTLNEIFDNIKHIEIDEIYNDSISE